MKSETLESNTFNLLIQTTWAKWKEMIICPVLKTKGKPVDKKWQGGFLLGLAWSLSLIFYIDLVEKNSAVFSENVSSLGKFLLIIQKGWGRG